MKIKETVDYIVTWLNSYAETYNMNGFIVGISGGIDSAVVSTLTAKTKKKVLVLEMPIHQNICEINRVNEHIFWLKKNFTNVDFIQIDLTFIFDEIKKIFNITNIQNEEIKKLIDLGLANTRSRLRMLTLYYYATINKFLVTGTGNKVEDFGIGFFTKYGDGGVDISPIGDLLKSQVYKVGKYLEIVKSIQNAIPTDGLWNDYRSDEDQIGLTYSELEWAMNIKSELKKLNNNQKRILTIYKRLRESMQHKINPIPICKIPKAYF